ncbi:MAG: hypothetical protein WBB74_08575 [Gaiellaceae bacterium]
MLEEPRWKASAFVDDAQLERAPALVGLEPDRPGPVTERVLDEVAERLLEAPPVGEHD